MGMESSRNQIANTRSHTHCQVAPAEPQAKTWRQRVSVPPLHQTGRQTN